MTLLVAIVAEQEKDLLEGEEDLLEEEEEVAPLQMVMVMVMGKRMM